MLDTVPTRTKKLAAIVLVLLAAMMLTAGSCFGRDEAPAEQASEKPAAGGQGGSGAAPKGEPVRVLETGNTLGIRPGGTAPDLKLDRPATLTNLTTYHYIDGGGPAPGTLSLKDASGKTYGPWQATGIDGQGGVAIAFWETKPMVALPAGTYTIVDSSPGTWSTNDTAEGVGFTTAWVIYDE